MTTPQEVALHDVRKGMMMFQKVNVPLLGIVENMVFRLWPLRSARNFLSGAGNGGKSWEFPFLDGF